MKAGTALLLLPQLALTGGLLLFSQFVFLSTSFHEDLGLGQVGAEFTLTNYIAVWHEPQYLQGLRLTLSLSVMVVLATLIAAWPVAYLLSRMRPRLATMILTSVVVTSFVPLPIKTLGLMIVFSADGALLGVLRSLDLVGPQFRFLGSQFAVGVGYFHLGIAYMVMMLFSTMQAIPQRLIEAARIHGASSLRALWRVVVPLSLPGTLSASLVLFNLLSGAFVSAMLLGGGRVLTLPVLIQQALILHTEYGVAATLSVILLLIVMATSLLSVLLAAKLSPSARVMT